MDVQKEVALYRSIKDDFISAVRKGTVSKPDELIRWLRGAIPENDLQPDAEFGFASAEEELDFAIRAVRRDPGAVAGIKLAAERGTIPDLARLMDRLLRTNGTASEKGPAERELRFRTFWDLMAFVEAGRMCTKPGCTTCGCMPFRKLVYSIGRHDLGKMIAVVSAEEAETQDPERWYEPFRLIVLVFPDVLRLDCPLVRRYKILRDECLAEIERRREESKRKQEEIHAEAAARREANRLAHEQRSREARERYYRSAQCGNLDRGGRAEASIREESDQA